MQTNPEIVAIIMQKNVKNGKRDRRLAACLSLQLIQLIFQAVILGALVTEILAVAVALDLQVPAHVGGPGVRGVAGEQAVRAYLDGGGVDEVVVRAAVPGIRVGTHFSGC